MLSQSGILGRELRPVTKHSRDEYQQYANRAHFTTSDNLRLGLKTIFKASKPSIRKLFVDKMYGINERDSF